MIGEIRENTKGTKMMIIRERNTNDIDVEFLDDFHYVKEHTTYINFKIGKIKNPYDKTVFEMGYTGVGKYKISENKINTPEYAVWRAMIARCYAESQKEMYKAYNGVSTMCAEWLNFQNFAAWYEENKYEVEGRLHIDKDIKYPGNKLYSPYHCILIPQRINMIFTNKENKRGLPNGIIKEYNKYYAKYADHDLGSYESLEKAYSVYAKAKKEAIVNVANEYKNIIPAHVYEYLMRYEVKIENDKNYVSN